MSSPSVVIRLVRRGRKNSPLFDICVAEARGKTNGRQIAKVGQYNARDKSRRGLIVNREQVAFYLRQGAKSSDTVHALLKRDAKSAQLATVRLLTVTRGHETLPAVGPSSVASTTSSERPDEERSGWTRIDLGQPHTWRPMVNVELTDFLRIPPDGPWDVSLCVPALSSPSSSSPDKSNAPASEPQRERADLRLRSALSSRTVAQFAVSPRGRSAYGTTLSIFVDMPGDTPEWSRTSFRWSFTRSLTEVWLEAIRFMRAATQDKTAHVAFESKTEYLDRSLTWNEVNSTVLADALLALGEVTRVHLFDSSAETVIESSPEQHAVSVSLPVTRSFGASPAESVAGFMSETAPILTRPARLGLGEAIGRLTGAIGEHMPRPLFARRSARI